MHLILVADDNKDMAVIIRDCLRKAGYRAICGYDGIWALDLAQRINPELAILNNLMPGFIGIEVTRQLRGQERTAKMKIIVTSASERAKEQALQAGADAFIKLPLTVSDLLRTVRGLLAGC